MIDTPSVDLKANYLAISPMINHIYPVPLVISAAAAVAFASSAAFFLPSFAFDEDIQSIREERGENGPERAKNEEEKSLAIDSRQGWHSPSNDLDMDLD